MKDKGNNAHSLEKKRDDVEQLLARMKHSSVDLHKTVVSVLTKLPLTNSNGTFNADMINTVWKYKQIVDSLAETSRRWAISKHFIYDVCLPDISDSNNEDYSPVYQRYASKLPVDQFGELDQEVFVATNPQKTTGKLVKRKDRLVGDARLQNIKTFGSAWNSAGEVINTDTNSHPILDGYAGVVAGHIDDIVRQELQHSRRDRHVQAFMIAHTRDREEVQWSSEPRLKESHIHIVIAISAAKSRYQMMRLMGYNFDDLTETFEWIAQNSGDEEDMRERADSFLSTLIGAIKNYVVPADYCAALRYLVHQSKKAVHDPQKTTYSSNEVISWLPDDPGQTYDDIASIHDNESIANNLESQVLYHLQNSAYCQAHHILEKYVGARRGDKAFTFEQIGELRRLGKKQPGKLCFSNRSKDSILSLVMHWIRTKRIQFSDCQILIHAAFNDKDADALIADAKFMDRLSNVLAAEEQAIISDPAAVRDMTTYCIFAAQGGIGKTRLANAMALLMDKYRKPYQVVTRNKQVTFDPFQNYESETSVIMDELNPSSLGWAQIKDLLDPFKIPYVGSRFHNKSPWNIKHTFITNVFENGISDYVNGVLHYAEGVSSLGYLTKDGGDWNLITNDIEAGKHYVSQLSQLLRRLSFVINLAPTENGRGTSIKVSTINFQPSGRQVDHYDYVHTQDSCHVFRTVINDDLREKDMEKIAKKVIQMVNQLKVQAKEAFKANPDRLLDEVDGFIADRCDFSVRYNAKHEPYLVAKDGESVSALFQSEPAVPPTQNLITILNRTKVFLWPDVDKTKVHVDPKLNQLDALLKGYEVPIEKVGFDEIKTLKLTKEALKLVNSDHSATIWKVLNQETPRQIASEYFTVQTNKNIANFKVI